MKFKHSLITSALLAFLLLIIGIRCKDEPVIPDSPAIKFSDEVLPIIIGNCTASGCHGNYNPQQFLLNSYTDVMTHGEVKAKNARGSKLYTVITSNKEDEKMPRKPNPDLTEKQIEIIYLWIMQGAKNN
ncbi:MAG: hypothetical protein IPP32_13155 [Bacteroidetes bacterium]|nr:hypothetical protein [Bacteroidota bacterium]